MAEGLLRNRFTSKRKDTETYFKSISRVTARVQGQVMGKKNPLKIKSLFQIVFILQPSVHPHRNKLLPLKSKTCSQRERLLNF